VGPESLRGTRKAGLGNGKSPYRPLGTVAALREAAYFSNPCPEEAPVSQPTYLRRNRLALGVVALFAIAGACFAPTVFPELSLWRSAPGGVLIGAFAGLCGVCHELLD
jgi:hypothetical protein